MSNRVELNELDLDGVVGGALRWKRGIVSVIGANPPVEYHFSDYTKCTDYIKNNCMGVQNEQTLLKLKEEGLVW